MKMKTSCPRGPHNLSKSRNYFRKLLSYCKPYIPCLSKLSYIDKANGIIIDIIIFEIDIYVNVNFED